MLDLVGTQLPKFPIIDLEWVQDLENFDGPLLSLFRHRKHGDSYLYYWCDSDMLVNRWMVLRVSETNVIRLINRLVPLDQVIPKACQDDYVYFIDMASPKDIRDVRLLGVSSIPEQYMPEQGAFLSAEVFQRSGTYSVVIERNLSILNFREFFKQFAQTYTFLYNGIRLKWERIKGHPWRGGFSAMHFWNEMQSFVPVEDLPTVDSMQYASPGFVRFKLDSDVAGWIGRIVALYKEGGQMIDEAALNLAAYFRVHKLNDMSQDDPRWRAHDAEIVRLTRTLVDSLELPSAREFMEASHRPFEAAKMAAAFVRKIRSLVHLESERLIVFPNVSADDQ